MLKKINLQLFAEPNAETEKPGDSQASDQGLQTETANTDATTETPKTETTETEGAETKGETGENATHKQTKEENSFFKSMRLKAEKEAEIKYKKQLDDMKAKIQTVLPDEYTDVDEFLNSIGDDSTQAEIEQAEVIVTEKETEKAKEENPTLDDKAIEEIVNKKLQAIPEFQELQERKKKDAEDKFVVDSFEAVKTKFPDIKTADDVPLEVWEMWQLGKNGRSLISCVKEYRYDNDIEKAKQKGAATVKSQINSVAHTGMVNGGNGSTVHIEEETHVPPETQAMLKKAGIPETKWAEYYKKYHR